MRKEEYLRRYSLFLEKFPVERLVLFGFPPGEPIFPFKWKVLPVSSGFLCSKVAQEQQETKVNYSGVLFIPLFTLFLFSKSMCSLCHGIL